MSDAREASVTPDVNGSLRQFRIGRRAVLQSLATGAGVAAFAATASGAGAHAHHVGAAAAAASAAPSTESSLLFLDPHGLETLQALSDQIVPDSRAAQVAEVMDRILSVESTNTQKQFNQALGAFERAARDAHGKPWKSLSNDEATALLTKMSSQPEDDVARQAFEGLKRAIAETYFSTEPGMKELGFKGNVAFVPPTTC